MQNDMTVSQNYQRLIANSKNNIAIGNVMLTSAGEMLSRITLVSSFVYQSML